ncbi:hypothetical protein Tco_1513040 [Tanacetum coccineum]
MRIVLTDEDKLTYLERPIPAAPIPGQQIPPYALAAHTHWVKASKEITCLMLVSMTPELQKNLEHFVAYDMLQDMKILFSQQVEQELLQTVRAFHMCRQEEGSSYYDGFVQNYNMHDMGKTVNELRAMLKLHEHSLPKKDATPAVMAIKAGRIQKKNKNKKPQNAAKGKNQGNGKSKLAYVPKPKIPLHQRKITLQRTRSATNVVRWVIGEGTIPCISLS